jgi:hypothetical protein
MDWTLSVKDVIWIGGTIFIAGGVFYQIKQQSKSLDALVGKDAQHDHKIGEIDRRLAVSETEIKNQNGWLSKIDSRLSDIFNLLHNKKD